MSLAHAEAQLSVQQRFRIARARSRRLLARLFDEGQHPRDEHGRWTDSAGEIDTGKVEAKTEANVATASAAALATGAKPLPGSKGTHPAIIATRNPTAKGAKAEYGQPDVASMKLDPKRYEHDIGMFKNADFYPNFRAKDLSGSTDKAVRTVVDQMKDNLKFLYQFADKHTQIWYDGARALVDDRAKLWGFNDASVAGVVAALSPTKDWDQNVHIADMLMKTYKTQQGHKWDEAMNAKAATLWSAKLQPMVDKVRDKTLGELTDPAEKAVWIRTYDETHGDPSYRIVRPNGALGEVMRNKDGTPSKVIWQTLPAITNAVKALEANGDMKTISAAMGTAHKVRSFYNNILDPHSPNGDVTIDTHAVGAALLRQLSGADVPVAHNFGNTMMKADQPEGWEAVGSSTKTGLSGLYPVYAQAYREAASELGIQPRQLQSAVWVVKRNSFGNASKATQEAIETAWHEYHDNPKVTLAQTRDTVAKLVGLGQNERRSYRAAEEVRHPGDARELHRGGVGSAAAAVDRRAGARAAGRAAGLVAVRDQERRAGAEELKAFDEADHPRDDHGRWTDSGGGDDAPAAAPSHGIEGLPPEAKISERLLDQARERGAFTFSAKEIPARKYESGKRYEVTATAKIPPGIKTFERKPDESSAAYYDPKLATLEIANKGQQYVERTYAKPLPGLSQEIAPLPGKDIIYRGMRAEEYEKFLQTGEVVSTGLYNIGDAQKGLTYWATDPATAAAYANGFAPWPHKATFEKPAYVVATKMPDETRKVAGVGENEVGVARPITKDEVVGVWRGDVFEHTPGTMEFSERGDNELVKSVGSSPESRVVWQKLDEPVLADAAPVSTTPMSHDEIQSHINKVAKENDFDPKRIEISDGAHPFVLNGVNYQAAGIAHITKIDEPGSQPLVTMFTNRLSPMYIDGIITHEIEHLKFENALNRYNDEYKQAMAEPRNADGSDPVMNSDGTMKPPFDKKYPAYTLMHDAYYDRSIKDFAASDGVSDYSYDWWKNWQAAKQGSIQQFQAGKSALHETLAEMARYKYNTGKFPDHMGERIISWRGEDVPKPSEAQIAKNATLWRNLYRAVDKVWKLK